MSDLHALIAEKLPGLRFGIFFHTDEDNGESSGFVVDEQRRHWSYWTETVSGRETINEWGDIHPEDRWTSSREYQAALTAATGGRDE